MKLYAMNLQLYILLTFIPLANMLPRLSNVPLQTRKKALPRK